MIIPLKLLRSKLNLELKGVLHVGAHECEEQKYYLEEGVSNDNIYWVEAMQEKVELMKKKDNTLNVYQSVIDVEDGKTIEFNVADNGQSSSIFDFGTHSKHHPYVKMIRKKQVTTTRLDTFIKTNNIPIDNINFMNIDIQGAELKALKSMGNYIDNIDYIYTEVNTEYVYKGCALLSEIDEFLSNNGFKRVACQMWGNCGWGDAFYIRIK
jgi:FkbM family methyltransferase